MLYRQIILEWGQDTESGVWGLGYSPDNGKNFYVLNTTHGRKYRAEDGNRLYPYISDQVQDKIETVVAPAKSAADSAVAYANDAIEKSRVNSQAIVEINSAVSDAVSGAAVARSDGLRAWNAAQANADLIDSNYASASAAISSARTEAIAAADEAKASASAAKADIVAVRSDVAAVQAEVTDFGPLLKSAQSDAGKALTQIADTASALSETKVALTSDVAVAKNLANAAQTTANSAIKSASSVANDLAAVASQAKANANGITKVTSDVGLLQTTVADNSGNISTIQETTKKIQQAVSDNAGNITVATQTANSAVTVANDARSSATVAIQTASQASITASNASGQAASAVLTANGVMTTASNAQSDATVAVQTASGASLTATNAKDDATVAKQTASEAKVHASNAESDYAQLSIRANKIEANVANNSGAIASVQQTANGLTTTVADIKANGGGVNLLTGTSGDLQTKQFTNSWNVGPQATNGSYKIKLVKGQTYTYRAWLDNTNGSDDAFAYIRFTPIGGTNFNLDFGTRIKKGETGYSTLVFTPSEDGYAAFIPFAYGAPGTFLAGWKEEMLEEGTVAHTWSPAPEDVQNQFTQTKESINGITTIINDPKTGLNATYQTAAGNATTISNAQGDIAKLKTRADGFDAEFSTANGNISKLQTDASGTKQTLTNAKNDIAVLQSRADGFDTKFADTAGDINTLKANASGFSQTLVDAKGDISTLQATATGLKNTLTDAQGNISTLQSDVSGLKKTTSDHAGNIATLQADTKTLTSQMVDAQGNISTLQQTASGISSKVSGMETSLADANGKIHDIKANGGGVNLVKDSEQEFTGKAFDFHGYHLASLDALTPGKTYTMSFSAKVDDKAVNCNQSIFVDIYNGSWPFYTTVGVPISTDYQRITHTFTIPKGKTGVSNITVYLNHPIINGKMDPSSDKSDDAGTGYIKEFMLEKGTVAHDWSPAPEDTDAKITTNTTAIEQNKQAITLKADQTTVDKTNVTVQKLQSQLKVQADQIATKVSSSDLDAKGYATQTYTQTQVKQTADAWNANLTSVKNGLTQSYTNLHATVDGIQAQVYNSDGSSKITQLSNLIATKVSQGDYNSQITQLKNDINLRVTKGDLISQINLQAGTALIQSNKLVLDAKTTVFTGDAFIPSAAIAELDADKLTFYGNGAKASIGASIAQYDDDKAKSTINLQYDGGIEIHSSSQQGSILTMHDNTIRLASKSWGDNSNPYQYSGFYAAPNYSLMNTYHRDGTTSGVAIDDDRIHIYGSSKDNQLGALQADVGWYSINGKTGLLTGNQISLKAGNTQAVLTDNNININNASDTNSNNYDVAIHIKGWAEMTGWFTCMGITQTSLLSTKTRIEPLDTKVALDKIVSANVNTYQFKTDVAKGKTKRHASVILDDVHDVAEYCTPEEFISEDRKGRDDGDIIGYLMGAVQELSKQLNEVKEKI